MLEHWVHFLRHDYVYWGKWRIKKLPPQGDYYLWYLHGDAWHECHKSSDKLNAFMRLLYYVEAFNYVPEATGIREENKPDDVNLELDQFDLFAIKLIERDGICMDMAREVLKL